jgi:hypothetical protein
MNLEIFKDTIYITSICGIKYIIKRRKEMFKDNYWEIIQEYPGRRIFYDGPVTIVTFPISKQKLKMGITICSENDIYSKKFGREKACERAYNSKELIGKEEIESMIFSINSLTHFFIERIILESFDYYVD